MPRKAEVAVKRRAPEKSERRRAPRYSVNPDTSCRVVTTQGGFSESAEVQNISTQGLRVSMKRPYDVGTAFVVEMTGKDGILRRELMVRVVRVQEAGDFFMLGCAFVTPLDGHELLTLVL